MKTIKNGNIVIKQVVNKISIISFNEECEVLVKKIIGYINVCKQLYNKDVVIANNKKK